MTQQETLYTIALTQVPALNLTNLHILLDEMGSSSTIFENRHNLRDVLPDASDKMLNAIASMDIHLKRAEEEMQWAEKGKVRIIGIKDKDYPQRMIGCPDAPIILYFRGNADLNTQHMVSMVGTRQITEYGKEVCAAFVKELKSLVPDAMIVSGLAYGVDIHCHRAALNNGLPTIGVVAHGLEQIYPRLHRNTAVEMVENGGILTEFISRTPIDKRNFVQRNRIVAGMTDATIVVESAAKGGSLITAEIANAYNRDVFAVPGRIYDSYSEGCNRLINANEAILLQSAAQFVESMNWQVDAMRKDALKEGVQQELFTDLTPEQRCIADAMKKGESTPINLLVNKTGIAIGKLSSILFDMEMKGIVKPVVGGNYRLL